MAEEVERDGDGLSQRLRMADIARLAGVSPATVSRALAKSPLVTERTRQRVENAVNATGYVVNQVASGLRLQRARQLLVLLPTIANPFFSDIVLGIEDEARAHGFGVLVGSTGGSEARESTLARQMLTGAVDGLIVLTGRRSALAGMADRIVAVSEQIPGGGVATVSIDHALAAREATAHLIGLGHRRLAHIAGPDGNILTRQRLDGFFGALASAGIPRADAPVAAGDFTFDSGGAAMRALLAVSAPPTAVFCANDEMAIGAINAAKAAGLRVPDDVSVVGFDDIAFAAEYDPPLTTIRQPRRAMGRLAASLLVRVLSGAAPEARMTLLAHELVIRASSGPIKSG